MRGPLRYLAGPAYGQGVYARVLRWWLALTLVAVWLSLAVNAARGDTGWGQAAVVAVLLSAMVFLVTAT